MQRLTKNNEKAAAPRNDKTHEEFANVGQLSIINRLGKGFMDQ
jgi:hypothetical protein